MLFHSVKTEETINVTIFLIHNIFMIFMKNGVRCLEGHSKVSKFTKFGSYWFKREVMVHF